ncbi:MAG TPA: biotin/lipoyl-containing protein [Acidimicrobiales bacterium]|nr:biotin/lipoyl-containing protein [Acidimicrobiales bacterium]
MIEVRVPKVGMSTIDVEVSSIQVRVGDRVAPTSVVVSVAADKVDFDIEAGAAGVVEELLVEEGSVVDVGTVVARIREDG